MLISLRKLEYCSDQEVKELYFDTIQDRDGQKDNSDYRTHVYA